ncbi:elongation factor P (EF-P) OB domain protein, partial [Chlamydia psittaci 84-8471/1]
QYLLS